MTACAPVHSCEAIKKKLTVWQTAVEKCLAGLLTSVGVRMPVRKRRSSDQPAQ